MEMEHKWAIFCHGGQIICVRSWRRKVQVVARVEHRQDHVEIAQVRGAFTDEDEEPQFTIRALDYLLRSHALNMVYPAPLPFDAEADPKTAAIWLFSMFGNRALIATPHRFDRHDPDRPLRTHSLLHIAVARGNTSAIEGYLAAGVPIDLLAGDGLAPLHWALVSKDPAVMSLLLDRGASVDVRSAEGATPLMNAVQQGSVDKMYFLLDHGADVDARDQRGFTAAKDSASILSPQLRPPRIECARSLERPTHNACSTKQNRPASVQDSRSPSRVTQSRVAGHNDPSSTRRRRRPPYPRSGRRGSRACLSKACAVPGVSIPERRMKCRSSPTLTTVT